MNKKEKQKLKNIILYIQFLQGYDNYDKDTALSKVNERLKKLLKKNFI